MKMVDGLIFIHLIQKIGKKQKIQIKDNFYYYYSEEGERLCMCGKSPCASYLVNKNVKHIKN